VIGEVELCVETVSIHLLPRTRPSVWFLNHNLTTVRRVRGVHVCLHVCVCVSACLRACLHVCVCACVGDG
jgi:hypothetical protein